MYYPIIGLPHDLPRINDWINDWIMIGIRPLQKINDWTGVTLTSIDLLRGKLTYAQLKLRVASAQIMLSVRNETLFRNPVLIGRVSRPRRRVCEAEKIQLFNREGGS